MTNLPESAPQYPEDSYESSQRFNPDAYNNTADVAEVWLPRIGGYDYTVLEELPASGAAIISPKHTAMIDVPLVGVTTRQVYGRPMRFVGKRELWELPFLGHAVGDYFNERGAIRLDRSVKLDNQPARSQVDQVLEGEELLVLFGEGTRARDRKVGDIKKGIGALAIQHGVPVQAVGVAGTRHWYGRKHVVYGRITEFDAEPIDPEDRRSLVKHAKAMAKTIQAAMQEATDEAYRQRSQMSVAIPFLRTTRP